MGFCGPRVDSRKPEPTMSQIHEINWTNIDFKLQNIKPWLNIGSGIWNWINMFLIAEINGPHGATLTKSYKFSHFQLSFLINLNVKLKLGSQNYKLIKSQATEFMPVVAVSCPNGLMVLVNY